MKNNLKAKNTLHLFFIILRELWDARKGMNESVQAVVNITYAAYDFAACATGQSGASASWAAMKFLAKARYMEGPWMIVDFTHFLYPQYDDRMNSLIEDNLRESIPELAKLARQLIIKDDAHKLRAHPNVRARWELVSRMDRPGVSVADLPKGWFKH